MNSPLLKTIYVDDFCAMTAVLVAIHGVWPQANWHEDRANAFMDSPLLKVHPGRHPSDPEPMPGPAAKKVSAWAAGALDSD